MIHIHQRAGNVAVQVILVRLRESLVEQSRLLIIDILINLAEPLHSAVAFQRVINRRTGTINNVNRVENLGGEIESLALVSVRAEMSITVKVGDGAEGAVDGDFFGVDAHAVAASVVVGEQARLQDGVVGRFPAGDHVGRAEVRLFDLGVVVFGVLGQGDAADFVVFDTQPVLGEVEDVVAVGFGLFWGHGGDADGPGGVVARLDVVVEVVGSPGVVLTGVLGGFICGHVPHSLIGAEVDTGVHPASIGLDKLVGVAGPAVHVTEAEDSSVRMGT